MDIEAYLFGVTPIYTQKNAQYPLLQGKKRRKSSSVIGTGFFYQEEQVTYLITNRHVAINEKEEHFPNVFEIILHTDATTIQNVRVVYIPLYDSDLNPLWFEHSNQGETFIDIIIIDIQKYLQNRDVLFFWTKNDLASRGRIRALETNIRVIGYPFGFHDDIHNLPIVKHATVASPYGVAFKDHAYYLIDGNLHEGMSGSPVIIPYSSLRVKTQTPIHSLLGVYSGGWKYDYIDLGLGTVWYPDLIHEIISCQTRGTIYTVQ